MLAVIFLHPAAQLFERCPIDPLDASLRLRVACPTMHQAAVRPKLVNGVDYFRHLFSQVNASDFFQLLVSDLMKLATVVALQDSRHTNKRKDVDERPRDG